jgi:hypothetical protein
MPSSLTTRLLLAGACSPTKAPLQGSFLIKSKEIEPGLFSRRPAEVQLKRSVQYNLDPEEVGTLERLNGHQNVNAFHVGRRG